MLYYKHISSTNIVLIVFSIFYLLSMIFNLGKVPKMLIKDRSYLNSYKEAVLIIGFLQIQLQYQ